MPSMFSVFPRNQKIQAMRECNIQIRLLCLTGAEINDFDLNNLKHLYAVPSFSKSEHGRHVEPLC